VAARQAGGRVTPIVGFDMGGTSTDVFHAGRGREVEMDVAMAFFAEEVAWSGWRDEIAGLRPAGGTTAVHPWRPGWLAASTSMAQRLQWGGLGRERDPGPACYRRGGPLTITDAKTCFVGPPAAAALSGGVPAPAEIRGPSRELVSQLFEELARAGVALATGRASTPEALAERSPWRSPTTGWPKRSAGFRSSAAMTPRATVGLLRAAPAAKHACALAERLGIRRLLLPSPGRSALALWASAWPTKRLLRRGKGWGGVTPRCGAGGTAAAAGRALVEANPAPQGRVQWLGVRLAASG